MNNLQLLKKQVNEKIKELDDIVRKQWGEDKIPEFNIYYELNSNRTLGKVKINFNGTIHKMFLNPELLEEFGDRYINEIVVHEYAHLVVHNLFPNGKNGYKIVRPHGHEFKAICSWFGIEGKATTKLFMDSEILKNKKRNTKKWTYTCGCSEFELSTRRRNLIQRESRKYRCKKCGNVLKKV